MTSSKGLSLHPPDFFLTMIPLLGKSGLIKFNMAASDLGQRQLGDRGKQNMCLIV
jgi:hypothetical protein